MCSRSRRAVRRNSCVCDTPREGAGSAGDVAVGLGWRVHGGASEARRGVVSQGMRFVSWGHPGWGRRGGTADRRNVFVELEWADGWGSVRPHTQNDAARVAGETDEAAGRGRFGVPAELQQISGGKDGAAEAGGGA